jgi:membrane protein
MPVREDGAVEQPEHGGPDDPLDIGAAGWRDTIRRALKEIKRDRITIIAAGVAFYWFLAIFPLLFAAVGLITLLRITPDAAQGIKDVLETVLPDGAAKVLTNAVVNSQARAGGSGLTTLLIGIGLALWGASSGMAATQVGLDVAYDVPDDRRFVKKRLMSLVLILATLVLGGVAVALLVFGEPLGDYLRDAIGAGGYFVWLWTAIRWILALLAVVTLFALFYFIGPNRQPPNWSWLSPGGILATVIWVAASVLFSVYVSHFGGSYAKTYGALAGVIILVLWLYFTALAILVGAELNGELERERALRAEAEARGGTGRSTPEQSSDPAPTPLPAVPAPGRSIAAPRSDPGPAEAVASADERAGRRVAPITTTAIVVGAVLVASRKLRGGRRERARD